MPESTLPAHPSAGLADVLRAELAARDLTTKRLAEAAGINPRTLRDHLDRRHPFTDVEIPALLAALRALGPFIIPQAEDALVIRAGRNGKDRPANGAAVPSVLPEPDSRAGVIVDTLELVLDPHPNERAALQAAVEATFEWRKRRDGAWWLKREEVYAKFTRVPGSKEWKALTVQIEPWRDSDRRIVQELRRAMLSGQPEAVKRPPELRVARIDVACDYAVEPYWLLLNRRRVRSWLRLEDRNGGTTVYLGARGENAIRVYDGAAWHSTDPAAKSGKWTRVEAEIRFPASVAPGGLPDALRAADPFPEFTAALRAAPGLSLFDAALVELANDLGLPYVRGRLDAKDVRRLNAAWKTLGESDARIETFAVLDGEPDGAGRPRLGWWNYVATLVSHQLLCDPDADARQEHLWWDDPELRYPPAP